MLLHPNDELRPLANAAVIDTDDDDHGTYWTPAVPMTQREAHSNLISQLPPRLGFHRIRLMTACAYDVATGSPVGYFEIALDPDNARACGVFRTIFEGEDITSKPVWFPCENDAEPAIEKVFQMTQADGWVL
ncbi:hypothetical protein EV130_104112 [Rhizobium azibense]|uniref:Uncharacterized protein n=1 Tax=Rhizobium azibense TaxID=1136135 RepID=A0A4R3QWM7_9HYPH|nr:hypothetical protein [Rhizobium azibense]TCU26501.1 hypothetical protein EV130_104112 [Rhizobium azibense]